MKRSRLRRVSKKRAALNREAKPLRDDFRQMFTMCQCCCKRVASDVHEICRGSHREAALKERAAWLCLCRVCHDELDDYSQWPITRQLALKLVGDPEFFDLATVNTLRGRDENAITLAEVAKWLAVK